MSTLISLIQSVIQNNGNNSNEWKEITNEINMNPLNSKSFVQEIKRIFKENKPDCFLLILNLVDYVVDECLLTLHTQISSRDFITSMLYLIKLKEHKQIQEKVLCLIKKWGIKFESQKDVLPNFYETYVSLQKSGVVFPIQINNDYMKYLFNENDFNPFKENNTISNSNQAKNNSNVQVPNYGDILLPLDKSSYPHEYHYIIDEIATVLDNITLENELINNADIEASVDDIIKDLFYLLESMGKKIRKAIEELIENENIMMICLGISEDIDKVMNRYGELIEHLKPTPFISVFKGDYSQYNMIKEQYVAHNIPLDNIKQEPEKDNKQPQNINLLSFDNQPVEISPVINKDDVNQLDINQLSITNEIPKINDIFDFTKNK